MQLKNNQVISLSVWIHITSIIMQSIMLLQANSGTAAQCCKLCPSQCRLLRVLLSAPSLFRKSLNGVVLNTLEIDLTSTFNMHRTMDLAPCKIICILAFQHTPVFAIPSVLPLPCPNSSFLLDR